MRFAFKLAILLWGLVSLVSLGGLIYVLPMYGVDGAFASALNLPEDPELSRQLYGRAAVFVFGSGVTVWMWRSYRRQYSKLRT
jgi:hypothetical protein